MSEQRETKLYNVALDEPHGSDESDDHDRDSVYLHTCRAMILRRCGRPEACRYGRPAS
jgi:hypothetical protein